MPSTGNAETPSPCIRDTYLAVVVSRWTLYPSSRQQLSEHAKSVFAEAVVVYSILLWPNVETPPTQRSSMVPLAERYPYHSHLVQRCTYLTCCGALFRYIVMADTMQNKTLQSTVLMIDYTGASAAKHYVDVQSLDITVCRRITVKLRNRSLK